MSAIRGHTWLLGPYDSTVGQLALAPSAAVLAVQVGREGIDIYDFRVPKETTALRAAINDATTAVVGDDLETIIWPELNQ